LGEGRRHGDGDDADRHSKASILDHLILLISFKPQDYARGCVGMLKPAFSLL
jgi:hypothetical protein